MTLPELRRPLPNLSPAQLHAARYRYRLYPAWVLVIEAEARIRELEQRPQGRTEILRQPSKLNSTS